MFSTIMAWKRFLCGTFCHGRVRILSARKRVVQMMVTRVIRWIGVIVCIDVRFEW